MQCLTRNQFKAISNELLVFREGGSFQDLIATIGRVIKKRVTDRFEMDTDLVGTTCFQGAGYQCNIAELLQHPVVGHRMSSFFRIIIDGHHKAVTGITTNVPGNNSFLILEGSSYQSHVGSICGVFKELTGKETLCQFILRNQDEA